MEDTLQILTAMVIYMGVVIVLGITFAKRANASSDAYFLGGRSLGPWVTAMSAEASDMSGWLLMGLPGLGPTGAASPMPPGPPSAWPSAPTSTG